MEITRAKPASYVFAVAGSSAAAITKSGMTIERRRQTAIYRLVDRDWIMSSRKRQSYTSMTCCSFRRHE
jgi:hypothetical protein